MRNLGVVGFLLLFMSMASAGPLEQPPRPGSKILRTSTFIVPPNGSSSNLFIPQRGPWSLITRSSPERAFGSGCSQTRNISKQLLDTRLAGLRY